MILLVLLTGMLTASGFYMLLRRSLVKIIIGLVMLGHAANLFILTVGRATQGKPAFVPEGVAVAASDSADPLPQALILTAIVIGFGVQAFALVLFKKAYQATNSDDIDQLRTTDSL